MTLSFKSFILRIEQFGLANFKLRSVSLIKDNCGPWFDERSNPRLVIRLEKVVIFIYVKDLELLENLGISICANLSNDMQEA